MTPDELATWAAEYQTSSIREMAARRGISWQAVQQRLTRAGIPRRPRGATKGVKRPHRKQPAPLREAGER